MVALGLFYTLAAEESVNRSKGVRGKIGSLSHSSQPNQLLPSKCLLCAVSLFKLRGSPPYNSLLVALIFLHILVPCMQDFDSNGATIQNPDSKYHNLFEMDLLS